MSGVSYQKNDLCSPTDKTTFLFAYSNYFDSSVVLSVLNAFTSTEASISPHYNWFGTIRLDVKNNENFTFASDWNSIDSYVKSHLPDPTLRCDVFNCYNDVMDVIVRFSEITQVPVCGARVLFLLKSETYVTDPPDQVDGLRKYHITATFAISNTPVSDWQSNMLCTIAANTNGFCEYNDDEDMQKSYLPACYTPYLMYAANTDVGGKGSIQLPQLVVPKEVANGYYFTMTLQESGPIESVENVTLSLSNPDAHYPGFVLGKKGNFSYGTCVGNHCAGWENLNAVTYNMTLDYEYLIERSGGTLQIRVYGTDDAPIDYWPAYCV
ncbi:unnamed protein product [Caenorhabditis brenneri]